MSKINTNYAAQRGITGGSYFEAGTFRLTLAEREAPPATPVPFHERPADRPMAAELGNGKNFAKTMGHTKHDAGSLDNREDYATYGMLPPSDPAHYRKRCGLPLYSWETRRNADS